MTLNNCGFKSGCSHWKIVGILGGMGPEATASFFYRIVAKTPAKSALLQHCEICRIIHRGDSLDMLA